MHTHVFYSKLLSRFALGAECYGGGGGEKYFARKLKTIFTVKFRIWLLKIICESWKLLPHYDYFSNAPPLIWSKAPIKVCNKYFLSENVSKIDWFHVQVFIIHISHWRGRGIVGHIPSGFCNVLAQLMRRFTGNILIYW